MQIIPPDHPLVLRMGVDVEDLSTILVGRKVFSGDIALVGSVFVQAAVTGALSAEVIYLAPGGELSGEIRAGRLVVAGVIRSRLVQCGELVVVDGASIDADEVQYATLTLPESGRMDIRGRLLRRAPAPAEAQGQRGVQPILMADHVDSDVIRSSPVPPASSAGALKLDSTLSEAIGVEVAATRPAPPMILARR